MTAPALGILVIDDDAAHAAATAEIARRLGHRVETAHSGEEGIERMREGGIDVVVTDLVMRDRSGLDVVAAAADGPEVIVMTAYGSQEAAPAVLRAGASAYLVKPLSVELFRRTLARVVRKARGRRAAFQRPDSETCFAGIIGACDSMRQLFRLIRKVADSHATVLIEGESGTGKELVARALHRHSPRAGGPFVPVNCAALSTGLLESELFGHVKGAFTGAYNDRVGRFEAADGGTLFLDEVGEMDAVLQAKLLRALEEHEVVRVGANASRPVDVRVVAATNRSLKERVADGSFRADLFYRLHVVRVELPPLRERRTDIPLLVRTILTELSAEHGHPEPELAPETVRRLSVQPWRGNVRELRNCIEALLLTAVGSTIAEADLPAEWSEEAPADAGIPLSMRPIAEVERELIRNTLKDVDGNRARAAEALGISARTLYRRIKELGLSE